MSAWGSGFMAGVEAPQADSGATWPEPLDLRELAKRDPEPPAMIIPDWLPCGYATLLAGHGGAGKSGIALQLAVAIATGSDWCGLPVAERRVLYLSCEDRGSIIHWRLRRICDRLGVDMGCLAERLDVLDLVGRDTILFGRDPLGIGVLPPYHELSRRIEKSGAELVVVDGVTDTFGGGENDRSEAKRYVNALVALIREDRGSVLLVAHVNKASASTSATSEGYSGSTGWHNAVRARWYLHRETADEGTGDLLLALQKSNHGNINQTIRFRWDADAHLFNGWMEGASTFDRRARDVQERDGILAALREVVASGDYCPAATTGRRTAYHVLREADAFPESLRADKRSGKAARDQFWRHIETLRRMQLVAEGSIRRTDGHRTATLVPKDCAANGLGVIGESANESEARNSDSPDAVPTAYRRMRRGVIGGRAHGECPKCFGDGDCYCGAP
ncbi:MAG: AAA family ATPase [Porticoccaceae bacterium]